MIIFSGISISIAFQFIIVLLGLVWFPWITRGAAISGIIIGIIIGFFLVYYFPIEDDIEKAFNSTNSFVDSVMDSMDEVRDTDNTVSE